MRIKKCIVALRVINFLINYIMGSEEARKG